MFLLSVLFMTGWTIAVMHGIAGNYAHLLGLASVTTIVMKRDRRHAIHRAEPAADHHGLTRPVANA